MNKTQRILQKLLDDIARFFPYFLGFYIFSLLLSLIFHPWKSFFNWRLFTISVVVLGIVSLFSSKVRPLFRFNLPKWKINQPKWNWNNLLAVIRLVGGVYKKIMSVIKFFVVVLVGTWKRLGRGGQIKIVVIVFVLVFALIRSIGPIDFIVLAYALASVLFIFESRVSAVLAIVLLASCPFFLMFKKDNIAEISAIYAYYFLVIAVITQIAEHIKENRAKLPN